MNFSDFLHIIQWGIIFFIIGVFFLPLTTRIFSSFFDKGYIFSKIIGLAAISYTIFILGITHIAPFTQLNIILVLLFLALLNFIFDKTNIIAIFIKKWPIFLFEELLFLITIFFWSFIRSHQPDIHGLEKYMDFGFVNSILRSDYFPPRDMWFTPLPINYYYFGHLVTAVLTKLSSIPSFITYNLMLSTLFAFTFTASFSIGANLIYRFTLSKKLINADQLTKSMFICGLLTALLISLSGNLHTIYTLFIPYQNEHPVPFGQLALSLENFPNSYWYPNATRFIYNTIHEFPIYSFVVSDLHGHVLDIPFVLLTIAILLSLISKSEPRNPKQYQDINYKNSKRFGFLNFNHWNLFRYSIFDIRILLLGFILAIMYMTNAWDGIIYFLLSSLIITYLVFKSIYNFSSQIKNYNLRFFIFYILFFIFILGISFIIFSLPFSLNFKPFVSGIGILCVPKFLANIGHLGPFLFEKNHCQRSPLWQLFILYGFFYFWITTFIIYLFKNSNFKHLKLIKNLKLNIKSLNISDLFVLILIFLSTLLIIIPEFIYAKDIYPAHYRANTMFKLVYESFMMLSLASGYIIIRIITNFKFFYLKLVIFIIGSIGLFFIAIYPYFAINSYYGNLQNYYGLNGTKYLKNLYPSDYEAINWLNNNIKGQPVILEAQGDSYTDYARVSANTGLPTVLGWTVHEWLWRGTYNIPAPRISEIQTLYENPDLIITKQLVLKYNIKLIFVGALERQKYPLLKENKFQSLGKIIYQNNNTKIYQVKL